MNVLSLFDGIACTKVALDRAGIKYNNYFASEIDKYAIAIAKYQHPDIIHLGDVTKIKGADLPTIDLIVAGSPCQGFSFSGKQLNFNDPRSKLFFEVPRLIKECKPKYFLLENVVMKQEYQDVISECLGVYPIMINSSLLSAQHRKRLYWTNIGDIPQPKDKHIYLKDIIESGVVDRDKSYCIDANYFKGGNLKQYQEKSRRQLVIDKPHRIGQFGNGGQGEKIYSPWGKSTTLMSSSQGQSPSNNYYVIPHRIGIINKGGQGERIYSSNGKSVTLSALGGGPGAKTGLYAIAQRGRYLENGKRKDIKGATTEQRLETSFSEKSNTLTSVQKDSLLLELLEQGYIVRKLTPTECEALQTLTRGYTAKGIINGETVNISNHQRYKALGNGFTVDVIAHQLTYIHRNCPPARKFCKQLSLF